jgi:UDP-N-acetyl-D-galactosamine dehydrogenase
MTSDDLLPTDAVIFAVAHDSFIRGGWSFVTRLPQNRRSIVLDVKSVLDRRQRPDDVELWRM